MIHIPELNWYEAWLDGGIQRFVEIEAASYRDAYAKAKEACHEGEVVRGVERLDKIVSEALDER